MIQGVIDDKVAIAKAISRTAQENPAWWCEKVLGVTPTDFERFCLDSWKSAKSLSFRQTIPLGERERAAALMLMAFLHLWQDSLVITVVPNKRRLDVGLWSWVESFYRAQKVPLGSEMRRWELWCSPTWYAKGFGADSPYAFRGLSPASDRVLVIVEGVRGIQPEALHPLRALVDSCEHGCFVEVD